MPAGNGSRSAIVELGRGYTLRPLAAELDSRRIITSARLFTLYARMKGSDSRVKAGYYQFNDGMRPGEILAKMVAGDFYERLFALPEGYSTYQIGEMLEKRGLFKRDAFLEACRDRKLLAELQINGESVEGYLLPGAYNVLPAMTERQLLREMVQRFNARYRAGDAALAARAQRAGISLTKLLTLASMVDKEAVRPEERPIIAAVFANRLNKGMRLQSDPTAVYGVRAFAGAVTKKDILRPSPYNTYLIAALPPGPIGNPSPEAAEAVLNHPQLPYLYFVARGDGSHCFSSTLVEHNRAVYRFLKAPSASCAVSASPQNPPPQARR
nr:endolytic transglycosylase MltG [Geomonas sp. RF6]